LFWPINGLFLGVLYFYLVIVIIFSWMSGYTNIIVHFVSWVILA
jgi:hypothetical protein